MQRFVRDSYPSDDLPRDLHPHLPSGRRVRVIIEDESSDEELRAELDREIDQGLASLDSGLSYTPDEVLARLDVRFGPVADAAE